MSAEPPLDVDLTLPRDGVVLRFRLRSRSRRIGVLGPSGSGKTTLLRAIAGLERAARGRLAVDGRVLQDGRRGLPPWRRGVGWMPQQATLFPHATVEANLRWAGAGADDARAIAERLGIAHLLRRRPRHLSGGERQRVALGRALLAPARLLLLDEPFSALDPKLRATAAALVADRVAERGAVLVLVSHDRADLARLCDEVWEARFGEPLRRVG